MPEYIQLAIDRFNSLDQIIIGVSLILFLAARPISKWLNHDSLLSARTGIMRALNLLIIFAVLVNVLILDKSTWLAKASQTLMVIYFSVLITQVINFFVRRRFGKERTVNDKKVYSDTYSSRGLSLIIAAIVGVVAIVSCLRLIGLNSLLEAGGALGIIGLMLAMTQAAWAPDIISGLIILNSRFCEEGDVIQFTMDNKPIYAIVFKTKLFHTECLDLTNNHRIMVRNARLRDIGIQNLSRFASARGLRERLLFNIDYKHGQTEVCDMMIRAFEAFDKEMSSREEQHDPEIMVHDTGDYAVTWAVYYYIKNVKSLLAVRQTLRAHILAESIRSDISLATPSLQQNAVTVTDGE